MKVLLATDGRAYSTPAEELVARILWPRGTAIELLTVVRSSDLGVEVTDGVREALLATSTFEAEDHLRAVSAWIDRNLEVSARVVVGRPATEIVEAAERSAVDLIVVGSRGRAAYAAELVGSVAAEVVDHAPCPVLVARNARLARIVLADDGSAEADLAAALVERWPVFQALSVQVVSVAPIEGVRVASGPMRHADSSEAYATAVDAVRTRWAAVAHRQALRLERAGIHARAEARAGDPAEEIVTAATLFEADLIVMGSRGHTGLRRLLLGSVARNVLTHAPCSVLIARATPPRAA